MTANEGISFHTPRRRRIIISSDEEDEDDIDIAVTNLTITSTPPTSSSKQQFYSCESTPEPAVLVYEPVSAKPAKRDPLSDAFWDQRLNTPQVPKSPIKSAQSPVRVKNKVFIQAREDLASAFVTKFIKVIQPDLLEYLDSPIDLIWSKTLTSTAGRATYSKSRKEAKIELSIKVIDSKDRLESTLAHELCHILTWVISKQFSNPHGKEFKQYGNKVEEKLDIPVATTHAYEIHYKYRWQCTNLVCEKEYGRHSKSLDPMKVVCGICKSKLIQIQPRPRAASPSKGLAGYQEFLKANIDRIKIENQGLKYADHIKLVAQEYRNSPKKLEMPDISKLTL